MTDATALLRQALHARLAADAALSALLTPGGLLDRPPSGIMPFILYGPWRSDDYSTATETGEEHWLSLEIWTDPASQRNALDIAARLRWLLDDEPLPLAPLRLVSLLYRSTRTRREPRARALVCEVSFRAVTEG